MTGAAVLIVEDENDMAEILSRTLNRLGLRVAGCADTGEKAIEMAGNLRPGLVLMDIMLPGKMDGIGAADAIRKEYGIPVIFITALTDDRTLERVAASAPAGFITKPFDTEELQVAIAAALAKKEAG